MNLLLINPPGREHYIRDYYCSKVAKADYSYSPVDLLMLSGRFETVGFLDAVQEKLSPEAALDRVREQAPDAVISLVSAVSFVEDREFLTAIKREMPGLPILGTGDVLLEATADTLRKAPWLDAVILDFFNADARRFLDHDFDAIENMVFRGPDGEPVERRAARRHGETADLPQPRHNLFLGRGYRYPFVRDARFATVQTDYGCPYPCRFCVMAQLGYQYRPVGEVLDELTKLRSSGIRDIYFNDQTFGAKTDRLTGICDGLIDRKLGLGWCCWSRVDTVADHLEHMRRAGCHTILFGVESAADETLAAYRKGFTVDQARRTFRECRRLGIRTLATFLIGLPVEDRAMVERTIDLALELDSDFASFNVFVPRQGTRTRQELAASGLLVDDETVLDQSGHTVAISGAALKPEEIKELRDRAVRRYYLRPGYMFKRLLGVRTRYDLETLARTAASMLWS